MIKQFDSLYRPDGSLPGRTVLHRPSHALSAGSNGEFCPYCGVDKDLSFHRQPQTHKCGDCRQRFSASRSGRSSRTRKFRFASGSWRSGLSRRTRRASPARKLAKDLKITQKTAWFMLHRLRHAARTQSFNRPLKGNGRKRRSAFGGKDQQQADSGSAGKDDKTIVHGLLERENELRVTELDSLKDVPLVLVVSTSNLART